MINIQKNAVKTLILAAVAAVGTVVSVAPAKADTGSMGVRVYAHEMTHHTGREAVQKRLLRAAKAVCTVEDRGTAELAARKECMAKALTRAEVQVAALMSRTQMAAR